MSNKELEIRKYKIEAGTYIGIGIIGGVFWTIHWIVQLFQKIF
jgi:hypothetical protein